jgi:iron complex transport system ATP-binding protein
MSGLTAQDLCLAYQEKAVLGPLDIRFQQGRLHIVLGPNGAGKSSLLRHLAGLLPRKSGTVWLDGRVLETVDRFERAKRIAYLGQDREIVWPLLVRDLVMLGRHPHGVSLETASDADWQSVEAAMRSVNILDFSMRPVTELSGGERARVLLARALATQADWLLLDEPIAGLDPRQQFLMMELLQEQRREGRSVLLVLHDLSLASRFADEILLLDQGRVVVQGHVEMALTHTHLAKTFGVETSLSLHNDGYRLQIDGVIPCNLA